MSARTFLGGALIGAGLVYFLDPEQGEARRERVRARWPRRGRYGSRLGDIHGLEAANLAGPAVPVDLRRLARLAGGVLAAYGLVRRGKAGSVLRTVGLGLAATARRASVAPAPRERRRTIDIQKTLFVDAPVEQAYAFGSNLENFPLFVSNVREVHDLGDGRWRWIVEGPAGEPVNWVVVVTEQELNRLVAWRSEPGALLENAGVIRFGPEANGTRIDFRFCYSPPAGPAARAVGEFFGADPRARLNADLGRLKTLLESTIKSDSLRSDPHG
jgi:uncharacterized membrane protein